MSTKASEELLAAPLDQLILNLGLAVAEANKKMHEGQTDIVYTIPEGEIEVNVALSISSQTQAGGTAGISLYGCTVNASYSKTYGFKEEASSRIRLKVQAVPKTA